MFIDVAMLRRALCIGLVVQFAASESVSELVNLLSIGQHVTTVSS